MHEWPSCLRVRACMWYCNYRPGMQFIVAFFILWLSAAGTNIRQYGGGSTPNIYFIEQMYHMSCAFPHTFSHYNVASPRAALRCVCHSIQYSYPSRITKNFAPQNLSTCMVSGHTATFIIVRITDPLYHGIRTYTTIKEYRFWYPPYSVVHIKKKEEI